MFKRAFHVTIVILGSVILLGALAGCRAGASQPAPTKQFPTTSAASPTSTGPATGTSAPSAVPAQSPTSAPVTTPTPAQSPTITPAPSGVTASPLPDAATAAPASTPYQLIAQDSGKTFVYTLTSRFSIVLDSRTYPRADLSVTCDRPQVIGPISNIPAIAPPDYVVRYTGVNPGTCTIRDRAFSVTIQIVTLPPASPSPSPAGAAPSAVAIPPGTLIGGTPPYLDDRSTPEQVLRSLANAIDRKEYDRAYSYWDPSTASGQVPPYPEFKAGYASTASVEMTFGKTTVGAAAGNLYFQVPTALVAHTTSGQTQTFVGCYTLHLSQPSVQDKPPYQPLDIRAGTLRQVPNDANTSTLLESACG